jgi:hypothetical protein
LLALCSMPTSLRLVHTPRDPPRGPKNRRPQCGGGGPRRTLPIPPALLSTKLAMRTRKSRKSVATSKGVCPTAMTAHARRAPVPETTGRVRAVVAPATVAQAPASAMKVREHLARKSPDLLIKTPTRKNLDPKRTILNLGLDLVLAKMTTRAQAHRFPPRLHHRRHLLLHHLRLQVLRKRMGSASRKHSKGT